MMLSAELSDLVLNTLSWLKGRGTLYRLGYDE